MSLFQFAYQPGLSRLSASSLASASLLLAGALEFDQGPDGGLIIGGASDLEPCAAGDPHAVTVEPRAGVKALGQDPSADDGFGFRRLSLFHEIQYRHEV
jgi:hypothetical protein